MPTRNDNSLDRRGLLKALGLAPAAVVATSAAVPQAQAYDPGPHETRARYQPDSPDVQAFYRTNGYETLKK